MSEKDPTPSPSLVASISPLLRLPVVLESTGLGRSTLYQMVANRTFPLPVQIGKRAVAWRHEEIEDWKRARPLASPRAASAVGIGTRRRRGA